MLKKIYLYIMLIVILFVFSGCKDFFTFNLFDGLDYVPLPTAEQLAAKPPAEGVDYLRDQLNSDSFMEAIAKDDTALAAVTTYLDGIYTNGAETPEIRTSAAVLAADLKLAVSGGDELVDNVWNALMEIQELNSGTGTASDSAAMQTILTGIIPPSIAAETDPVVKEAAFKEVVAGLLNAADIYETLGTTILAGDPVAANSAGDITGGTVLNAAITGMLDTVVGTLFLPGYDTPEAAAGVFWALYSADPGTDPATIEGINPVGELSDNAFADIPYLGNIATAAGFDIAALFPAA